MNIVSISDLSIYQKERLILHQINLQIQKGEFVYLTGHVGSGKSSLMKTIYAENKVQVGEASVLGFDLNEISHEEIPFLRRKLGIVFQDFQLLTDRTVYDNLKFVLQATDWTDPDEIHVRIVQSLKMVSMDGFQKSFPHELSGGEQQRVAIARALLNHAELILADEPTGNLDPNSAENILQVLHALPNQNCSVLMITHDYGLIKKFPGRILAIKNNRIEELGTIDELKELFLKID